jgi:hypothetical protein
MFKFNIEEDDMKGLLNNLKEYETYSISKLKLESVVQLYLYALTHLFSNKMYEDFLRKGVNDKYLI